MEAVDKRPRGSKLEKSRPVKAPVVFHGCSSLAHDAGFWKTERLREGRTETSTHSFLIRGTEGPNSGLGLRVYNRDKQKDAWYFSPVDICKVHFSQIRAAAAAAAFAVRMGHLYSGAA